METVSSRHSAVAIQLRKLSNRGSQAEQTSPSASQQKGLAYVAVSLTSPIIPCGDTSAAQKGLNLQDNGDWLLANPVPQTHAFLLRVCYTVVLYASLI